jgi:DNA-3-methyladenine glycosylase II
VAPGPAIAPAGPFSLERAAGFGFGPVTPGAYDGAMRLAFAADGLRAHAGAVLRQPEPDGPGTIELAGDADPDAVRAQVARVLSLDHDGDAWLGVGDRDPVLAGLQAAHPGLCPVLFHSPYEAAAWAILSARRSARQAAGVHRRLSEAHGAVLELAGEERPAFPLPEALLALDAFPGLEGVRLERLHAVARAALDGRLEAGRLRAIGPEAATAELLELPGIGPFYAGLILLRAVGTVDVAPKGEPKLERAVQQRYGAPLERVAEKWKPFRTWVSVLMRSSA